MAVCDCRTHGAGIPLPFVFFPFFLHVHQNRALFVTSVTRGRLQSRTANEMDRDGEGAALWPLLCFTWEENVCPRLSPKDALRHDSYMYKHLSARVLFWWRETKRLPQPFIMSAKHLNEAKSLILPNESRTQKVLKDCLNFFLFFGVYYLYFVLCHMSVTCFCVFLV